MKIADIARIKPKNVSESNVQLCNYWYNTTYNGAGYVHLKTNIANQSSVMFHIHFEGYNYDKAQSIDSVVTGYTYSGWPSIYNQYMVNYTGGVTLESTYISSDNYVCIRLYASSWYYAGFVINAMFPCPSGRGHVLEITDNNLNQNSGSHF